MDRISINNLFPNNDNDEHKELNVYTLYNPRPNRNIQTNFSIQKLIESREEKEKKIYIQYEKLYKQCLRKIDAVDRLRRREFIFEIPESIFGHYDYNKMICLEYIEHKLKKMYIDTCIITDNSIYINWTNVKKNMANEKKKQEENNKTDSDVK